jgi:hypothetical protein
MGAPASAFEPAFVGHVPGTQYGVSVDVHSLVTHNAAILGILGAGKTHLAWELIARMLDAEVKVLCLDISGRYSDSDHFREICPPEIQNALEEKIATAIEPNYLNATVRNHEAGNLHDFAAQIDQVVAGFVTGDDRLLIVNPNRFQVSRMKGNPFSGKANMMVDLTMVEVTRLIAESALRHVQALERDPKDERARVCLVLEEAHSLVPEWNSAASDQDEHASCLAAHRHARRR